MTYCYACECGWRTEIVCPASKMKLSIACQKCGGEAGRDLQTEFRGTRAGNSGYPKVSYSMGVAIEQVPELMDYDRKHGLATEYTSDGDPVFRSKAEQDRYMKIHGFHHRNSYV